MNIDVVVPSYKRSEKLKACITSVRNSHLSHSDRVYIHVYFSCQEDIDNARAFLGDAQSYLLETYRAPTLWNDHLNRMSADVLVYLNDDVVVDKNCLSLASEAMEIYFPDYDGLIGFFQSNIPRNQGAKSAFGMLGKRFAQHFPDCRAFCPDYYRFYIDTELETYARSVNKFYFSESIKVVHFHPAFYAEQKDTTHSEVRKFLPKDKLISKQRTTNQWLWGRDFNLIGA